MACGVCGLRARVEGVPLSANNRKQIEPSALNELCGFRCSLLGSPNHELLDAPSSLWESASAKLWHSFLFDQHPGKKNNWYIDSLGGRPPELPHKTLRRYRRCSHVVSLQCLPETKQSVSLDFCSLC